LVRLGRDGDVEGTDGRLDADHSRDDGRLELAVGVAEEVLHGLCVEAAGDLLCGCDGVVVAADGGQAARLEFVLERLEYGLGRFDDGVDAADFISEGGIGEIMEAAERCGILRGSRDRTCSVRWWLGPMRKLHLSIGLFFVYH
jgi:hypothetical protein